MAGLVLTARDLALFASLREYRLLTTEQLQALHFPSRQTMLRRVRLLTGAGYVRISAVATLGTRVVTLTERGQAQLPVRNCAHSSARVGTRSQLFLPHAVQLIEFRLRLAAACAARADIELVRFITDSERAVNGATQPRPHIREEVPDPLCGGQLLARVPDGVFALRRGGKTALFFLEIDRGTEVVGHADRGLAKVARFYAALLLDGRYQRYAEDFGSAEAFRGFRALLVLPSERRLRNVRERCGQRSDVPREARRFIWLAEASALFGGDLLNHSWVSLDPTDSTTYILDGSAARSAAS
jgi:hypothetical protein